MIRDVIESLMRTNRITRSEFLDIYYNSTNQSTKKLISLVDRVSDLYSLTYEEDYEIHNEGSSIMISFNKYYSSEHQIKTSVLYNEADHGYTIIDENQNSLILASSIVVEEYLMDYYRR